jgi:hypothetical protein
MIVVMVTDTSDNHGGDDYVDDGKDCGDDCKDGT